MSKKNNSSGAVKFLIYILIFLILILAFAFLFIIPQITKYKNSKANYETNSIKYTVLLEDEKELSKKLSLVKEENKKIIETFSQEFSKERFTTYAKKYFDEVKLIKLDSDTQSQALKTYKFSANLKAQNPKKLYSFVKDLQNYKGVVKINFPITIISKNNHLEIKFHLSAYSMNSK